jgi:hypothetical protein
MESGSRLLYSARTLSAAALGLSACSSSGRMAPVRLTETSSALIKPACGASSARSASHANVASRQLTSRICCRTARPGRAWLESRTGYRQKLACTCMIVETGNLTNWLCSNQGKGTPAATTSNTTPLAVATNAARPSLLELSDMESNVGSRPPSPSCLSAHTSRHPLIVMELGSHRAAHCIVPGNHGAIHCNDVEDLIAM